MNISFFSKFSTDKYRWFALVFLALGLAIVVIDNTVLNVAIPYILRDLHTSFDAIQWVVSGYALIIATLLITVGRLGDLIGRKKVFLLGTILFAIGSFIASISQNVTVLFIGEALIEAIGASMMLTSSLSLLVSEFQGRERSLAFGVWGSVAGASATIGPLLGGFLTTYYSWRWSLRINVFVSIIAILGSIFIKESKGHEGEKGFDWWGTIFSGLGLFFLVFGFIEGRKYGWFAPNEQFSLNGIDWPFGNISIIPFVFALAIEFLILFIVNELRLERQGKSPILRMSLFKNIGFSLGLATLNIVSLGQFGVFFIMPIFLQNVLGLNAFNTGLVFLWTSVSIAIFGPLSGFLASKFGPKWLTSIGMFILGVGAYLLRQSIAVDATGLTLAPGLVIFGIGVGMASAQLTNIALATVPVQFAGEASAANSTMRQVGTSIGIAIIGMVLASSLTTNITKNIQTDSAIPSQAKEKVVSILANYTPGSGQQPTSLQQSPELARAIKSDINNSLVTGSKDALTYAILFILAGAFVSLFIPNIKPTAGGEEVNKSNEERRNKEMASEQAVSTQPAPVEPNPESPAETDLRSRLASDLFPKKEEAKKDSSEEKKEDKKPLPSSEFYPEDQNKK